MNAPQPPTGGVGNAADRSQTIWSDIMNTMKEFQELQPQPELPSEASPPANAADPVPAPD